MILIIAVVAVFLTDDVLLCVTAVPVTDSTLSTVSNTSPPMTKALYDPIHMPSTMGILFPPPRVNPILKTKAPLVPSRIPIQTVRPPIITEEIPASPGAMSLLYVFSEASKRLPIAELPMRVESMGNSFNNWAGEAGKYVEKHAVSFSDTLVEYLTSAAGEAVKRSGELISTTIDTVERTVKGYLSDWIGCRPPPG